MKLLVTGGAGFIGSYFIRYVLESYPQDLVINLDKLTYAANLASLDDLKANSRYRFVQGDICDKQLVGDLVKQSDAIVHFAAESHVDRSIAGCEDFIRTNVMGTYILLDACRINGGKRFHHVSTDEVFGDLSVDSKDKFNEYTPYNPRSPYAASKASSDHFVRSYFYTYQLPITISNCSNNYGPYQNPEKFIPRAITNVLEGKKIPLYGDGSNKRDWLYVLDHCKAIDLILRKGRAGETYCIGGENDKERSNKEIALLILRNMGKDENLIEYTSDRLGHDRKYAIDYSKIEKELGWKPEKGFEERITETIRWYKNNQSWWKELKTQAESFYSSKSNPK